jgi:alkylation response protein AidB-like acyl-CoA dehydrogenase
MEGGLRFEAPVADMLDAMRVAGLDGVLATGAFGDLNLYTVGTILEEAGRFASAELAPLNRVGDQVGARLNDGRVVTPPGWPEAYMRWIAAGWNGVGAPVEWGGQGLPVILQMALQEEWNAACAAFAAGPMLTAGAIDALLAHGSPALNRRFLPRLVSGEWVATMNLTEPQAGSDLGALPTRAERSIGGT